MFRKQAGYVILGSICSATATADTLTFVAGDGGEFSRTEDTFITSAGNWADTNFSEEGYLFVDQEDGAYDYGISTSLLRFPDVFGPEEGQVPSNAVIQSATVQIYVPNPGDSVVVYEILEDWDIDEVSWNTRSAEDGDWSIPGAADEPSRSTKILAIFTAVQDDWSSFNITQAAEYWAENPNENYGVVILAEGTDGMDVYSSEADDIAVRPMLTVSFDIEDEDDSVDDTGSSGTDEDSGRLDTGETGDSDSNDTGSSDEGQGDDGVLVREGELESGCGGCSTAETPGISWFALALSLISIRRFRGA